MQAVLILFYSALGLAWIFKGRFWRRARLRRSFLAAVFLLKTVLGIGYGLTYFEYYQTGDIVHYFQDSKIIYSALPERPGDYLELSFGYSRSGQVPEHLSDLYERMRLSWRTQEYISVRFNALFNLFSFGHYYVNVVFMALLSMIGLVLLYETLSRAFPDRALWLAFAVFLIPSTLFWCSGIHKDGITLLCLCVMIYGTTKLATRRRSRYLLLAALAGLLLWNTRAYILLIVLPNLLLYYACLRRPGRTWLRFASLNAFLVIALSTAHVFIPRLDFLGKLAFEQQFLLDLKGSTHLPMRPIGDDLGTLLSNVPMALDHVLLKPFTHRPTNAFQWVAAITSFLQLAGLLLLLVFSRLRGRSFHPLLAYCFVFGVALYLLIGLTVPSLGAIVRYKSVALPFLFAAAIVITDPARWPLGPPAFLDRIRLPD